MPDRDRAGRRHHGVPRLTKIIIQHVNNAFTSNRPDMLRPAFRSTNRRAGLQQRRISVPPRPSRRSARSYASCRPDYAGLATSSNASTQS